MQGLHDFPPPPIYAYVSDLQINSFQGDDEIGTEDLDPVPSFSGPYDLVTDSIISMKKEFSNTSPRSYKTTFHWAFSTWRHLSSPLSAKFCLRWRGLFRQDFQWKVDTLRWDSDRCAELVIITVSLGLLSYTSYGMLLVSLLDSSLVFQICNARDHIFGNVEIWQTFWLPSQCSIRCYWMFQL